MDLNTVDWSRVCGAVAYSGGIQICVLATHGENTEHFWVPAERVPAELEPCQASTYRNGVLYLCGLYGRHVNRDHEWVRPSELRPAQISRARPNPPRPEPTRVRHPTERDPLCLAPNPSSDGTLCALPPDHALSGHDHYYVRLGGPGPGASGPYAPGGAIPDSDDPPVSQGLGRPPTRPEHEYDSTRERDTQGRRVPASTTRGTRMSSVGEVKAQLDAASALVVEGREIIHAAAEKFGEARLVALSAAQGTSSSEPGDGVAALSLAVETLETAVVQAGNAINAWESYGASL